MVLMAIGAATIRAKLVVRRVHGPMSRFAHVLMRDAFDIALGAGFDFRLFHCLAFGGHAGFHAISVCVGVRSLCPFRLLIFAPRDGHPCRQSIRRGR